LRLQHIDVEALARRRPLLPMKSIGLGKAGESLVVTFGVIEQHAERKARGNPFRDRTLTAFQNRFKARQLRLVRAWLPGHCQAAVDLRAFRIEIQRVAKAY
jgi:hypothetical protein